MPVILIDEDGNAVKSIKFRKKIDLGDPVNTVSIFNSFRVDELILLDIAATKQGRLISLELLADIASEAKMPFSVGGGITKLDDIRKILSTGAEKVVISTAGLERPEFVREAAERFGSSSIMVCIDVQKNLFGNQSVRILGGSKKLNKSPLDAALQMEKMGAGEIIIQSIDRDGTMSGYDLLLTNSIASAVSVPVIALGGAGCLDDMKQAYAKTHASAFASGSLFCFQNNDRGVLINYPNKKMLNSFRSIR
jgi:imidazole glycerol-phosphate synthase subunit HisF